MITKNEVSAEDYERLNREYHAKLQRKEQLTISETAFICDCLPFKSLLSYPFCIDEFFHRAFVARHSKGIHRMVELEQTHHTFYENLINEWAKTIDKTNHSDQLLQVTAKDARDELKELKKRVAIVDAKPKEEKFAILEWSKFRYILVKEIFELVIKSDSHKLYLNNIEILFTYYSLSHILTRHFGHGMKPYESYKSHFTKDIRHDEIHMKLQEFFKLIDESQYFLNDGIEEVNIRYKGTLYKIFSESYIEGKKSYVRVGSFFPTVNQKMLDRLRDEFVEKKINNVFSVFTGILE